MICPAMVGGVVRGMEKNVAYEVGECLAPGVGVGDGRVQVDRLQDLQGGCEVGLINERALLQCVLLMDTEFLLFQDPGIPHLVRVQHVAKQREAPFRQIDLMNPELADQLLVEVVMIGEDILEQVYHKWMSTGSRRWFLDSGRWVLCSRP